MVEMRAYGCYDLQVKLWDGGMNEVGSFAIRQDFWVSPDTFVVRLTRGHRRQPGPLRGPRRGRRPRAHRRPVGLWRPDRRAVDEERQRLRPRDRRRADFVMVATQTAPDYYRCFRRLEVKKPTRVFGTEVGPSVLKRRAFPRQRRAKAPVWSCRCRPSGQSVLLSACRHVGSSICGRVENRTRRHVVLLICLIIDSSTRRCVGIPRSSCVA